MSMSFSRQEHWSGEPFPSPGDLLNPGITLRSPALQADSLPSEPPGKPLIYIIFNQIINYNIQMNLNLWVYNYIPNH